MEHMVKSDEWVKVQYEGKDYKIYIKRPSAVLLGSTRFYKDMYHSLVKI